MTFADIMLTLREYETPQTATDRAGQVILLTLLGERRERLAMLTREQRIELERLKADLT